MHLVVYGHFESRDKDGGHIIRSIIAKITNASCILRGSVL